jgi:hypothetical protein
MHDLQAGQIRKDPILRLTPISAKQIKNSLAGYHWQQIVQQIVHRFVREIAYKGVGVEGKGIVQEKS